MAAQRSTGPGGGQAPDPHAVAAGDRQNRDSTVTVFAPDHCATAVPTRSGPTVSTAPGTPGTPAGFSGSGGAPIDVPILVSQGDADQLVLPSATADLVGRLCAAGEHVTYRTYEGIDHGLIGERTEALQAARARVEILTPLAIDLPQTNLPDGRELVAFKDVVMAFGERQWSGPLSFDVRGPERIAVRGANGSGKTTLFRLITGELEPSRGDMSRRTDRVAVLDQHVGLLDPALSILDNLRRLNPELTANEAHAALARFAFRNRAALQIARTLSGGERLRAAMACAFKASRAG